MSKLAFAHRRTLARWKYYSITYGSSATFGLLAFGIVCLMAVRKF